MPLILDYRQAYKKRIMLGITSEYSNVCIPNNNYDPIFYGKISSNTTSVITIDTSISIGGILDSNSAYCIELDNGRFFYIDTTTTKTSDNSTATILSYGYPFIASGEDFTNSTIRIRRVISFYDLINGGLVASGAFTSGADGTGDKFFIYGIAGTLTYRLFRTATTWRDVFNVTRNSEPVNMCSSFARTATASGTQLIIEVPISRIV